MLHRQGYKYLYLHKGQVLVKVISLLRPGKVVYPVFGEFADLLTIEHRNPAQRRYLTFWSRKL